MSVLKSLEHARKRAEPLEDKKPEEPIVKFQGLLEQVTSNLNRPTSLLAPALTFHSSVTIRIVETAVDFLKRHGVRPRVFGVSLAIYHQLLAELTSRMVEQFPPSVFNTVSVMTPYGVAVQVTADPQILTNSIVNVEDEDDHVMFSYPMVL